MASSRAFPLEIFETILDFLAAEDDQSLSSIKVCSLVAHCFLPRARTHIFYSITLDGPHYPRALSLSPSNLKFGRLISENPEIALYVRAFSFCVDEQSLALETFATALGSLANLESLTVDSDIWIGHWKDSPLRETVLNLMHTPTLYHLKLMGGMTLPISHLTLCINLKSLETQGFQPVEVGRHIKLYQEQPPRLETFKGTNSGHNIRWLLKLCDARRTDGKPFVDLTGLKRLSLEIGDDPLNDMKELFKHFTQLTEFEAFHCEQLLLSGGFADLFLPSLQTLQHIHLQFHVDGEGDPFLPLVSKFASISGRNIIESIKISVIFDIDVNYTCGDEWSALDQIFTQSESGWKNLKLFSLYVEIDCDLYYSLLNSHVDGLVQELQKLPGAQLRGLASSEDIIFRFSVLCDD